MDLGFKLLRWYHQHGRDLPWRKTKNPYKILVSEIMLQQTQVPRVLLFYKKWLRQFPSWKKLAAATNADVIKAWAGLGYNRRALALRDIARQVVKNGVPQSRDGWMTLKGIGPYTSAALATFTGLERAMPIDTNIRRVLGRVYLGKPYPSPADDQKLVSRTQPLLSQVDFDQIPQALFDLATTICKKVPDCNTCPLRDECLVAPRFLKGTVKVPKAMIKKNPETIHRNKHYPDRIYRGRILKLVREKPGRPVRSLGPLIDTSFDPLLDSRWLKAMIKRLEYDQMIKQRGQKIFLHDG